MGMRFTHSFLIFIFLYIIIDFSTTYLFLQCGWKESNPIYFTHGFIGIFFMKILFIILLLSLRKVLLNLNFYNVWNITYFLFYVGAFVPIINNLSVVYTNATVLHHIGLM